MGFLSLVHDRRQQSGVRWQHASRRCLTGRRPHSHIAARKGAMVKAAQGRKEIIKITRCFSMNISIYSDPFAPPKGGLRQRSPNCIYLINPTEVPTIDHRPSTIDHRPASPSEDGNHIRVIRPPDLAMPGNLVITNYM
jgi:hypothetical protein